MGIATEPKERGTQERASLSAATIGSAGLVHESALNADSGLPGLLADEERIASAYSGDGDCGGDTKRRSSGAKRVQAWVCRTWSETRDNSNTRIHSTTSNNEATAADGHPKKSMLRNLHAYSFSFLPYDLNRPSSPEKRLRFSYTCN